MSMPKPKVKVRLYVAGWSTDVGSNPTGSWRSIKPELDESTCTQCWTCVKFCPEGVIDKGDSGPVIDYAYCKGCGICANECPTKSIKMVREG
jgi:2-oxoacid:acceptor oxidoreductase delta subunit (pyruvate/2-ketoisovalerate family)